MNDLILYLQGNIKYVLVSNLFLIGVTLFLANRYKTMGTLVSIFIFVAHFLLLSNYIQIDFIQYVTWIILPSLFLSLLGLFLVSDKSKEGKINYDSPFCVEILDENKKKHWLANINTGVAIFGASGSGKSASAIYFLLKHFAKKHFAGVIYDYKDYELTEVAYPLFKKQNITFHIFNPNDVNRSVRINPIDPKLLSTESDVNSIVSTFVLNLSKTDANSEAGQFFQDGAESLISAVVWRLKTDFPEKCNFPFITAFLLSTENHHSKIDDGKGIILVEPFKKLADWICRDQRAEILGSVFLSGLANQKQTGSLYSTLAASLRQIANPETFYLLGDNDLDLGINGDNARCVVSVVNTPGVKESAVTPILATVIDTFLTRMSERHRKPSFVLLDEAPTIKIKNLARRIATLRSFGLAFVYCVQDMIQSVAQWGGKQYKAKEIFTNLSTMMMGKVNDADTAAYYEKFFEIIEEDQTSISKGESSLLGPSTGGTRLTVSKKERSKVRKHEFFKLKEGKFIIFSAGEDKKIRFLYEEPERYLPLPIREMTPTLLDVEYLKVLNEAKEFLK